jgi:predicted dehydrogenase
MFPAFPKTFDSSAQIVHNHTHGGSNNQSNLQGEQTMVSRRDFLTTAAAATLAAQTVRAEKKAASERVRVGVVGSGGRALSLIKTFSANPEADVVVLADIDSNRLPRAVEVVKAAQGTTPKTVKDFRNIVDDPTIDALVVGTPDHWHAIPTIMACQACKDVYVEKPDSHNIVEGQRMVAAQRKHKRIVQMGTQARTTPRVMEALEYIRTGKLGRCLVAKAWESARQGSIGHPPDSEPPAGVDYDFWLGPAPKRPFNRRRFHGSWRWFYDYGTGDLGNDGVHRLDIARWALSIASEVQGEPPQLLPEKISAAGGKWYFDDMQEWPDTLQVNYEFAGPPRKLLTYEMRIWAPYRFHGESEGAAVYGDKGYIIIGNTHWRAFGPKNQPLAEGGGDNHEGPHVQNFLDCIKSRKPSNADLATVGHISSVLCHGGNLASRVGRTLTLDPQTETFVGDAEANRLRTREVYRKPWELPEV